MSFAGSPGLYGTTQPEPVMTATILQSASQPVTRTSSVRASKAVIAGRIISGIAIAFMAMDTSMKLFRVKEALEGTVQLGFNADVILPLGLIQLAALVLYIIPRTAPIGALLFTGYLGGAVAIHVQQGNPMFTHILSPMYVATLLWGGLFLRDARVRAALGINR
jgi:DoxX-like protein